MFPNCRLVSPRLWLFFLAGAFLFAPGCKTSRASQEQNSRVDEQSREPASPGPPSLADAMLCFKTSMQNAPAPFHFSYKKGSTGSSTTDWEADITPDTIEGYSRNGTLTDKIHGMRADARNWNTAILVLIQPLPGGILGMARSATRVVGPESVNGYDTIKYLVDTSQPSAQEGKLGYKSVTGAKDYNIIGSAWLTKDTGCMVKFVLDYEQDFQDGRIDKAHYEGSMTKH